MSDTVPLWRAKALDGIPHGFAGRQGGLSTGAFASLNVGTGSGEDESIVMANRRRATDAILPGADLASVYQVHGRTCITTDQAWPMADRPHADALVTATPSLVLGILTADCVPVLFADKAAGIVGAAHAGWKGALAGVTDATIEAMVALGADRQRISAAIGPCIARASYEVDAPLRDAVCADDPANERFFADGQRADHWQFDLEAYVAARIAAQGVATVEMLGIDTYARESECFSFRRATHRDEPSYGRQISMIAVG